MKSIYRQTYEMIIVMKYLLSTNLSYIPELGALYRKAKNI